MRRTDLTVGAESAMPEAAAQRAATAGAALRALAFSSMAQAGAKVLHLGLNVVASLALIRYLGPAGYGDYVFVFSFTALVGLLSDFGLSNVAVREMSRQPGAERAILGTAVGGRLGLAAFSWALAQALLFVMGVRADLKLAIAVTSLLFVTDALLSVVVLFQVRLAMQYEALVSLVIQALDTLLILWLISRSAGLLAIVAIPVCTTLIGIPLAWAIGRARFGMSLRFEIGRLPGLLTEALPVGLALLVAVTYLKLDSVLLALLRSPREVGLYGAAYKPVEYLLLASAVLINPMFPLLSRWRLDRERFQALYRRGSEALLAFVLPIPVVLTFVATPLLLTVYTPPFAPAAVPMRILSVALVFMVVNSWQGFVLLSRGRQRVTLAYDAAGLVLNVILNLALIRLWGYLGAAVAALLTSIFIAGCAVSAVARVLGATADYARLPRVVLSNVALAATFWLLALAGAPWWVALPIAGLGYPAWLLLFQVTNLAELRLLLPNRESPGGAAPALETS